MNNTRFNLAKQVSIISYLNEIGYTVTPNNKKEVQIKAFWRGDTNPSVTINTATNQWYDFGTNQGGSIIDLVSIIDEITPIDAVNKILKGRYSCFSLVASQIKASKKKSIEVVKVCDVTHPALKSYLLNTRKIPDTVYTQFVKEVHYKVGDNTFFAVGFKNSNDGWVLRNKVFKGCTSQHYTYYNNGCQNLLVFEGVFDFLSYLTISDNAFQSNDYLILNTTANITKASKLFDNYKYVSCYLDNDAAGRTALESINNHTSTARVEDCSMSYEGYNDYNDWHIAMLNKELV